MHKFFSLSLPLSIFPWTNFTSHSTAQLNRVHAFAYIALVLETFFDKNKEQNEEFPRSYMYRCGLSVYFQWKIHHQNKTTSIFAWYMAVMCEFISRISFAASFVSSSWNRKSVQRQLGCRALAAHSMYTIVFCTLRYDSFYLVFESLRWIEHRSIHFQVTTIHRYVLCSLILVLISRIFNTKWLIWPSSLFTQEHLLW